LFLFVDLNFLLYSVLKTTHCWSSTWCSQSFSQSGSRFGLL